MCVSYLFRRQRPRRLILVFAEMRVIHVLSCRGHRACAQLVLVRVRVLVLVWVLVLVRVLEPMSGVYGFTHEALH